jgi:hypothetical protein
LQRQDCVTKEFGSMRTLFIKSLLPLPVRQAGSLFQREAIPLV